MTKRQKITVAAIGVSTLLLYATGVLWPLVRASLVIAGVGSLVGTFYFGIRAFFPRKDPDAGDEVLNDPMTINDIRRLAGSAAMALFAFVLLDFIPSAEQISDSVNGPLSITEPVPAGITQPQRRTSQPADKSATTKPVTTKPVTTKPVTTKPTITKSKSTSRKPRQRTSSSTVASSRDSSVQRKRGTEGNQAATQFMEALINQAQQNQRNQQSERAQRFNRALKAAQVCTRCGGAGNYRYVDGSGVLQAKACPSCNGTGKAF